MNGDELGTDMKMSVYNVPSIKLAQENDILDAQICDKIVLGADFQESLNCESEGRTENNRFFTIRP